MKTDCKIGVAAVALALCFSGAAAGAPPPSSEPPDLRAAGTRGKDGRLVLTMEFGRLFKTGAKVYSEPSHTLILLGMAPDMAQKAEGKALSAAAEAANAAVVITEFPGASPRVQVPARPASDDRVAVWAMTSTGDFLVADGKVGNGDFSWTTRWTEIDGVLDPTHCCNAGCGQSCTECPSHAFTCCWCIPIQCGWVKCPNE